MLERLVGRVFPEQQKAFVGVKVDLREQRRSLRTPPAQTVSVHFKEFNQVCRYSQKTLNQV